MTLTNHLSIIRVGCLCLLMIVLVGCSTSRYSMKHDAAPEGGSFDAAQLQDAVPIWEPLSRQGNKSPYTVRGETYQIVESARGFEEQGVASWYGLKFHGELTSNGEIYNMYEMSAAHKTLPLPSYVRVTNQGNQLSVVVRVNDRGPFHGGRIIDLSYAAAKKLGYADKGTANVRLETLVIERKAERTVEPTNKKTSEPNQLSSGDEVINDRLAQYVQIAAYSNLESAQATKAAVDAYLAKLSDVQSRVFVAESPGLSPPVYRVRAGPVFDKDQAEKLLATLKKAGLGQPILITRAMSANSR